MKIVCDACSAKYSIADEKVRGKVFKIRCKKCSNIIVVRGNAEGQAQQNFDQKETRVFDYQGYDDPSKAAEAAVAGGAGEAVWHVVIDQEQVGPMTAAEVGQRLDAREIDTETYIWREGFADWQPLNEVDAFAHLSSGGGAAAAPAAADDGGLFGGAPAADDSTAQSDPGDLFAAASAGDAGAGGGDLFGDAGGMAASAPAAASPFGGGEADSLFGGNGAGAAPEEEGSPQLRGQRNENSVLFSLSNLADLASDKPKAAGPSPSPSSAPSGPGLAQAGGTEGSGLIDIRSMASAYLGGDSSKSTGGAGATGSVDDLPVFSQTSFDQPSAVLLPTTAPAASGSNKLLYGLVAAIGLLAIIAVVLVVMVLKGGGDGKKTAANAAKAGVAKKDKDGDKADKDGDKADKADKDGDTSDKADKDGDKSDKSDKADKDGDKSDKEDKTAKTDKDGDKKKPTKLASNRHSTRHSTRHTTRRPTTHHTTRRPTTTHKTPKPSSGGKCDEVECMLNDYKGSCCAKYKKGGGSRRTTHRTAPARNLPDTLTRSMVKRGIAGVRGSVQGCSRHKSGGGTQTVMATIRVRPSGSVSSVSVSPGGALGNCVKRALRRAHFKATKRGRTFQYPFLFR